MAKKVFEHRCHDCGEITDVTCEYEDKQQTCEHCGGEAYRIISAVVWGNENSCGVDGSFPGAAAKWERDTTRRHKTAGQSHQGSNSQIGGANK